MKVLIVFALISVLANNGWAQDLSCKELETMAENGLRKMFLQEEGASLPTNEAEVESRCNEGKKLYKALLEYKKCLGPFPQQIFGATTTSIGKLLKKNCGDAEGKKMALKLFQCATPEKVKESQKCVAGSLDSIEKISQSAEGKKTIVGQMCCLAHVATDCAREKIGGITCPDPSVKPMEFFDEAINSLSKETMELACEDFKTMDQCNAKIPESVAMLKKSMVDADSSLKDRHLIKPLLKIADKVAN